MVEFEEFKIKTPFGKISPLYNHYQPLEKRKEQAEMVKSKYSGRIPIIIFKQGSSKLEHIDKNK